MSRGITPAGLIGLALGLAFLYLPLALVVLFSFNASRLVTVWAGASLRWYGEMLSNAALLGAAWISLAVGVLSATLALLIGLPVAWCWRACRDSPAARSSVAWHMCRWCCRGYYRPRFVAAVRRARLESRLHHHRHRHASLATPMSPSWYMRV